MPSFARLGAAGLMLWLALGCGGAPSRPSVVVVLIDTLRADHLGIYGYERPTSPTIDALARDAWVFDAHMASAAQTVPSTLSMLLSLDPAEHGFLHEGDGHFARHPPRYPDTLVFLAEAFAGAGYRTAAFVGNPFLQANTGFGQGFDALVYHAGRGEKLTEQAEAWLEQLPREAPFFLYLHYFDVHWPYNPPLRYRDRFLPGEPGKLIYRNGPAPEVSREALAPTVAMYDAEIAYVDAQLARLLSALAREGRRERTIVVVTSDHGEEFLDHGGLGHGTSVYGELVRVPLLLAYPPKLGAARRVAQLTRHVDLAPTLLELAGVERPAAFRGTSLLGNGPPPVAFSEDGPWRAVHAGDRKLVVNEATGRREWFRLDDLRDQRPLGGEPPPELLEPLEAYRRTRAALRAQRPEAGPAWSPEELERLRSLGYVK